MPPPETDIHGYIESGLESRVEPRKSSIDLSSCEPTTRRSCYVPQVKWGLLFQWETPKLRRVTKSPRGPCLGGMAES